LGYSEQVEGELDVAVTGASGRKNLPRKAEDQEEKSLDKELIFSKGCLAELF